MRRHDDRGQAFTLEGFVASVLVLTAILLALQSVVLTPTTSGTVDQQVQQQLRSEAHDIFVATASNYKNVSRVNQSPAGNACWPCDEEDFESHDLSYMIRYWNGSENVNSDTWAHAIDQNIGYGSREPMFSKGKSRTIFGQALKGTFTRRGYVYNVIVEYRDPVDYNGSSVIPMVYRGVPSDNAITTTYTVTLYDNDTLTAYNNTNQPVDCTEKPIEEIKPEFGPEDWNSSFSPDCFFAIPESAAFDNDNQNPIIPSSSCPTSPNCPKNERGEVGDSPIYNIVEIRVVVW